MGRSHLILPEIVSGRGTARRVVEGQARRCRVQHVRHDRIEIAQNIARRDTQRFDPMFGEQCVTTGVALGPRFKFMCRPIDFDAQPLLSAVEIQDVRTSRMLPTKFEAVGAGAKLRPQRNFGERHRTPKLARASDSLARFAQPRACPATMLCMVPLPKQSLGRI